MSKNNFINPQREIALEQLFKIVEVVKLYNFSRKKINFTTRWNEGPPMTFAGAVSHSQNGSSFVFNR